MQEEGRMPPAAAPDGTERGAPVLRLAAWLVHLLTASGAVFGLLALVAAARGQWLASFQWMTVTLVIDSVDGALARYFRVKQRVPGVDGALLDNVVDYFTYAAVPAFFFCMSESLLPHGTRVLSAAAILLASSYQFSRTDAKTPDHAFSGFPSYWNVLLFYLFVSDWPPVANLLVILACAVMSFLPLRCLYPSRTRAWRPFNLAFGGLWAASLMAAILTYPENHRPFVAFSWAYVAYYCAFSAWMTWRGLAGTVKQD